MARATISGPGSFTVQSGDHFRSWDHLRAGIICGLVHVAWFFPQAAVVQAGNIFKVPATCLRITTKHGQTRCDIAVTKVGIFLKWRQRRRKTLSEGVRSHGGLLCDVMPFTRTYSNGMMAPCQLSHFGPRMNLITTWTKKNVENHVTAEYGTTDHAILIGTRLAKKVHTIWWISVCNFWGCYEYRCRAGLFPDKTQDRWNSNKLISFRKVTSRIYSTKLLLIWINLLLQKNLSL